MQYTPIIQKAYNDYSKQVPLDLGSSSKVHRDVWREVIQFSLPEYARKVATLARSSSLDEFVIHSGGDFDNLAPVIRTAINNSLLTISSGGKIIPAQTPSMIEEFSVDEDIISPYAKYNQFPCDGESSNFRARFILDRYPYRKTIHIGLIGDDDFISLRLMKDTATKISVVEKDIRIIEEIRKHEDSRQSIDVYELDIRDTAPVVELDTFVTDPPYTFDGSLAFIGCGLSMMGPTRGKEFYVILNPTMIGRRWSRLIEVLAAQGIVLIGAKESVSNYRLPDNFDERRRADVFLRSINVQSSALNYSSNSTMFTFLCTDDVDVDKIRAVIDNENIYEHYA